MSLADQEAGLEVRPIHPAFGAEIRGIDLKRPLDAVTAAAVQGAFLRHSVLVFPEQDVADEEQVAFSRLFGDLEVVDFKGAGSRRHPNVYELSNVDESGEVLDARADKMAFLAVNERWHTDSSFKAIPSKASILSARRVPPVGGDTCYASMRVAWETLPAGLKRRVEELEAVHHYAYSIGLYGAKAVPQAEIDRLPPVVHPLVRSHPSGHRSLFVSGHIREIVGLPVEEGLKLRDELIAWATRPEMIYRHRWRRHDIVMWDNRCALHRAVGFPPGHARIMHRTTVAGDGPVA